MTGMSMSMHHTLGLIGPLHFSARPAWLWLTLAVLLAAAAWWLYHRQLQPGWRRKVLPPLRAFAVLLAALVLAGPELRNEETLDTRHRLVLLLDDSASMALADPQMPTERKLQLLQAAGLIDDDTLSRTPLTRAVSQLDEALQLARSAAPDQDTTRQIAQRLGAAGEALAQVPARSEDEDENENEADIARVPQQLLADATTLADDDDLEAQQRAERVAALEEPLRETLAAVRQLSRERLDAALQEDPAIVEALANFDATTRWQRMDTALLTGENAILPELVERFRVEVVPMSSRDPQPAWTSRGQAAPPAQLPGEPAARSTDIRRALQRLGRANEQVAEGAQLEDARPTLGVLISDGQHNDGQPPLPIARDLAAAGTPLYTVGFGSLEAPPDLAILDIDAPDLVHIEDRLAGRLQLMENMPAGTEYRVSLTSGETVLWEQQLTSEDADQRTVAFDAAIRELVEQQLNGEDPDSVQQLPLDLTVSIDPVDGERELGNNAMPLEVRATTTRQRMLILAGRPRWEMRYLHSTFERDPRWETTALLSTLGEQWRRGEQGNVFPSTREGLFAYDAIVFGEVPFGTLTEEELQWLRDFVDVRGGGMIIIDGDRGHLLDYSGSVLAGLLPVRRLDAQPLEPEALALTEDGQRLDAMRLQTEADQNVSAWPELPPPHQLAPTEPIPGVGTVLAEGMIGDTGSPAVVLQQVGAGQVWYHAFDQTWRWRRDVADLYQTRYWHQVVRRIIEPPYAAADQFTRLGVEDMTVPGGGETMVRARVLDTQGRPLIDARVAAVLYDSEGGLVSETPLQPDPGGGGRYRGEVTLPDEPGGYSIGLAVARYSESDLVARAQVRVTGDTATGELARMTVNRQLLEAAAQAAGGRYLPEEESASLLDLLGPGGNLTVIQHVSQLWRSWFYFIPIVLALGAELLLRRRAGLV
jgi:hypothetical protein